MAVIRSRKCGATREALVCTGKMHSLSGPHYNREDGGPVWEIGIASEDGRSYDVRLTAVELTTLISHFVGWSELDRLYNERQRLVASKGE